MPTIKSKLISKVYIFAAWTVAFIIFVIDINLPLGVAHGSLYVGLILVGLLTLSRKMIIIGGVAGSCLTIAGYFFSPEGGDVLKAIANRIISILTIWMTAFFCINKQKTDDKLKKANINLENRITERTSVLNQTNIHLERKNNYLRLHKNIAEKVNEDIDINQIFQYCLKQICVLSTAQVGHLYLSENRYSHRLLPEKIWHMADESEFQDFKEITEQFIFESGTGLPGRVYETKKPLWIENIEGDLNFPRVCKSKISCIKSGFAFPIFIGEKITGVMEFFFNVPRKSDGELLELMGQIGIQLGRALERRFSETDRDKLLISLNERIKELTCMSEVAKLITVSHSLEDIFENIEKFIIPAWQYPEIIQAQVSFDGKIYGTKILPDSPWNLSTPIMVNNEKRGVLKVSYSETVPEIENPGFLKEEKNLLIWLGQIISSAASKIKNAEKLEESYIELRGLYKKFETVREEERTRIAREIHDELGQALTICKIDLSWLNLKTKNISSEIKDKINSMLQHIDTTLQELNRITAELRPHILNVMGLTEALKLETEKFITLTGIKSEILISETIPNLHPELSTLIFRTYQETLTNIIRHSKATNVNTKFMVDGDNLILTIKDNGRGFEGDKIYNSKSFGLTGIRERVKEWDGKFSINGSPEKGAQVTIKVPLITHTKNEKKAN